MTRIVRARCASKERTRIQITLHYENRIIAIIKNWNPSWGKLTGDALADRVLKEVKIKWSRQGILKRSRVRDAFDEAVTINDLSAVELQTPIEIELLLSRVKSRDETIGAKDEEIRRLKEALVRQHYDAWNHGISLAELEAPIPPIVVPAEERLKPGRRMQGVK